jgi:hypothetical protein
MTEMSQQINVKFSKLVVKEHPQDQPNSNPGRKIESIKNRDVLAMLAFGKKEREEIIQSLIDQYWLDGTFELLAPNINRVFGKAIQYKASTIRLSLVTGKVSPAKGVQAHSNRGAWIAIFKELNNAHAAKPFTGEKLLYLTCINHAIRVSNIQTTPPSLKVYSTQHGSSNSIGDARNIVGSALTLPEVLTWVAARDRVAVAALRTRLLPLGLLPNAVINEVNERALDLIGEIALEEVADQILVIKNVFDEVLANWNFTQS